MCPDVVNAARPARRNRLQKTTVAVLKAAVASHSSWRVWKSNPNFQFLSRRLTDAASSCQCCRLYALRSMSGFTMAVRGEGVRPAESFGFNAQDTAEGNPDFAALSGVRICSELPHTLTGRVFHLVNKPYQGIRIRCGYQCTIGFAPVGHRYIGW